MLNLARCGTRDLSRAKVFYDEIAALLGAERVFEYPKMIGYKGAEGATFIVGLPFESEATVGNGVQFSFVAPSRAAVDAVHAKALELGGKCEGAPGVRGPEENGFYAAYFRDLDGNKLMAFRQGAA